MGGFRRREFCGFLAGAAGATLESSLVSRSQSEGGRVLTTRREIEAAFENLSSGDTIRIGGENAPYRTTRWLDIDVDDVTVVGPGRRDLIKPADGANVGGLRIGHNERCRGVTVRGVGYHGNPDGQERGAKRLHGIAVRDAEAVRLERNRIRQTYPRRHGDGGSGISVTHRCSYVQILHNRIHDFGDRGVQLAGRRIVVSGNVVSEGLDRPVACDLWYPDDHNRTARSATIYGNVLGNTVEGSLVGVARNTPLGSDPGYISVLGNVGFGTHKSFCHVRGPEPIRNVSVQSNVSVQTAGGLETKQTVEFAGVAVDVESGANVSVKNNELHGYSGHGVHVDSDLENLSVRNNDISDPGLAGIRVAGCRNGVVDGNLVTGASTTGIDLADASGMAVRNNYVHRAGAEGIVADGSEPASGNDIAFNYVSGNGRRSDRAVPAIAVRDVGVRVRGNSVLQNDGPAIAEEDGAKGNLYEDNWADGERPWRIPSPTSRVRNHSPPVDEHKGVSADGTENTVRVRFDRQYAEPPQLAFGRRGGGIEDVEYWTDGNGDYAGAVVTVGRAGGSLDVFVTDG